MKDKARFDLLNVLPFQGEVSSKTVRDAKAATPSKGAQSSRR
jgi:hypothetical protein